MSEPGSEGYAASKGGIYSLTHALALSLSEWNITVNSIAPGWIQTHDYNQLQPEDHSQHPSRRVGKPEDIARMCLFLCEENNDFINGENFTIDGGMTKKMIYILFIALIFFEQLPLQFSLSKQHDGTPTYHTYRRKFELRYPADNVLSDNG